MSDHLYFSTVQSLKAYCNTLIAKMRDENISTTVQFIDWDEHADIHELPAGDLIGVAGCGMAEDDKIHEAVFAIGFSTQDDKGLFKLRKFVSQCYDDLQPEKKLPVYNALASTPTQVGWMVMKSGTAIVPMTKAEVRPFQFVEARALLNPLLPSVL